MEPKRRNLRENERTRRPNSEERRWRVPERPHTDTRREEVKRIWEEAEREGR